MPYFSSDQTRPLMKALHAELERLSELAANLQYAAMDDALAPALTVEQLCRLGRHARDMNRRLYLWNKRVWGDESEWPNSDVEEADD